MKFMVTWVCHPEKRQEVYKTFAQMTDADDEADRGGVKLIGRWHDLAAGSGVGIGECDDVATAHGWALNWNGVLDPTVTERWSPIFGQVVKVESRSDRRNLECHERDGATRLS